MRRLKPYYLKPRFKLYRADSLEFLKTLPAKSVDMIFADPPYFLSGGSFTCMAGKRVSVKKADWDMGQGLKANFNFQLAWLKACWRLLKDDGSLWISGTYHSIYQCGYALQLAGYHILNDIAWFKPNAAPNLSCRFLTASHETLIWARKTKSAKHTFNYKDMVDWSKNYTKQFKCQSCQTPNQIELFHQTGKQMRSLWAIATPPPMKRLLANIRLKNHWHYWSGLLPLPVSQKT